MGRGGGGEERRIIPWHRFSNVLTKGHLNIAPQGSVHMYQDIFENVYT